MTLHSSSFHPSTSFGSTQGLWPCLYLQWFVIGHDCGHRSFHKNNLVEDIVGTLMFMPLIYPFEPWRIKHNHHHAHTNK
jgi:fatty acid desaturase